VIVDLASKQALDNFLLDFGEAFRVRLHLERSLGERFWGMTGVFT